MVNSESLFPASFYLWVFLCGSFVWFPLFKFQSFCVSPQWVS
jgi:hypothetical protein